MSYFHSRQGCNKVDKMLCNLYKPILWKALSVWRHILTAHISIFSAFDSSLMCFCSISSGSKLWGACKCHSAFHWGLPDPRPRAEQPDYRWDRSKAAGHSNGESRWKHSSFFFMRKLERKKMKPKAHSDTDLSKGSKRFRYSNHRSVICRASWMTLIPLCAPMLRWECARSWPSAGSSFLPRSSQTSWRSWWQSWRLTKAPPMSGARSLRCEALFLTVLILYCPGRYQHGPVKFQLLL